MGTSRQRSSRRHYVLKTSRHYAAFKQEKEETMAVDFAAYVFPGRNTAEAALRDAEDAAAAGAAWIACHAHTSGGR